MIKLRKWFFVVFIGLMIAASLFYGFSPKPVPVEVISVSRSLFRVIIEEEGKTRIKDRFEISAPVAGILCRIGLEIGDPVKAGEPLCSLSPLDSDVLDSRSLAQAEAKVLAEEAALETARKKSQADAASAEYGHSEYDRIKKLYDIKMVSRSEFDRVTSEKRRTKANLESSLFAVQTARFYLEEARSVLRYSAAEEDKNETGKRVLIRSPVDGNVLKIPKESGGPVRTGQVLMEVGDPTALEVEIEVLSADAVKIQPEMRVLFQRWGGSKPLEGKVRTIEPVGFTKVSALGVEEQRVRVIADIASPPAEWERLGDGYRVDAQFILWEGQKVLKIPSSALFRYQEGWAVFVVGNNRRVEIRAVGRGKSSGLEVQILSGLSEGELVVFHPDSRLEDRSRIVW